MVRLVRVCVHISFLLTNKYGSWRFISGVLPDEQSNGNQPEILSEVHRMRINKLLYAGFYCLLAALALTFFATVVFAYQAEDASSPAVGTGLCPQKRATPHAPAKFLKKKNPLAPTAENIEAGAKLFLGPLAPIPCTTCHGVLGNGLGDPDFESTPPSRNFTCKKILLRLEW